MLTKIKDQTATVEFIESSAVYPIIMILISVLISISLLAINKSLSLEIEYYNSRLLLNSTKEDFQITKDFDKELIKKQQKKINSKLDSIGQEKIKLDYSEGIFMNKIQVNTLNSGRRKTLNKYYPTDFSRKIDFVIYVADDVGIKEILNHNMNDLFNSK